jgi:hypothetical protein
MSGVKGQKWYHRYHQSYKTKPTRSGKVGTEHMTVGTAYDDFVNVMYDNMKKMKELKWKSFFNKKYKEQLEEAKQIYEVDRNIYDALYLMILETASKGASKGDNRITTNNGTLTMHDQYRYALKIKTNKKEIEKYIDKYQKEIEKGKSKAAMVYDTVTKYLGPGQVK